MFGLIALYPVVSEFRIGSDRNSQPTFSCLIHARDLQYELDNGPYSLYLL